MARSVMEGGLSKAAAARQFHTTPKTTAKWVARFQAEGPAGLDGSLVPTSFIAWPNDASRRKRALRRIDERRHK